MKFDALFEMKEPEFFKEAELNETFIKQVGVTPEFGENSTLRNLVEYF
mgnify:CR=1 FL=1